MRTENIKIRILVPFTLALAFIIAMFIFVTYRHMHSHLDVDWNGTIQKFQESFKTELDLDAQIMNAVMEGIIRDESLRKALKNRDRAALLKEAQPLFRQYLAVHNITHLYFHGPDRVNILRMHKPEQYGDRIDRFTLLEAEKIISGKGEGYYAKGIELGPLGMFTNRVVFPWFDGKVLIGYMEMGKELDRVMEKLRKDFGIGLYIFIHKEFLDRGKWEEGMKMLGRKPDWDRYPYSVNVSGPIEQVSEETIQTLAGKHLPHSEEKIEVKEKDRYYHFGRVPLVDAGGREVGHMVVFSEYTAEIGAVRSTAMLVSIVFLGVGAALFVFFYIVTGRTERDLVESKTNLERQRDKLDRLNADLSILYNVSSRVSSTIELSMLLNEVLHVVLGLSAMGIESKGGIFVLEGEGMKLVTHTGFDDSFLELHKDLKKGDCLCGIAAKTGEVVVSKDSYKDERHTIRYEGMTRHGHIILPLKAADRIEGVLCLYMPADIEIDKGRMDMLATLGSQIGIAIGNAKMYLRVRESEETLKAILNATTDAMFLIDPVGNILTLNETTALRLGKTKDELIGTCIYDYLPPDIARSRRAYVNEAISSGKTVNFEDERNGEWVDNSIYPIFNEQEKIVKVAIYGRYITDRKKAESEVRENENRYRSLFERENSAVMIFDGETLQFEDANQRTLSLFGYTKEEFMNLKVSDISAEKEKTAVAVQKVKNETPDSGYIPLRHFLKKDGTVFPGEIFPGTFMVKGRKKIIGVVNDITERKKSEDKLKRVYEELQEKTEYLERFNRLMVGRELEMIKLKAEVNELLEKAGQAKKYDAPDEVKEGGGL